MGCLPILVHSVCGDKPYRTSDGGYSDGTYSMSSKGNSEHTSGTNKPRNPGELPPSQFLYGVDDVGATFAAAAYADANNLWIDGQATVYVTNGPIGVTGSGELTSYITVAKKNSGTIHGWPANPL